MTIEELEIIIRANITDAMSGIKKITSEVKQAIDKSVEPMKQMTTQAKEMANKSASSVSQMKSQMKSYSNSIQETTKQQEYLKTKIEDLKELLKKADRGWEFGDTKKIEADIEKLENKLRKLQQVKPKIEPTVDEEGAEQKLSSLKDYIKTFSTGFVNGLKGTGKLAGNALVKGFQLAVNGIKNVAKKITGFVKNIASKSKTVGKEIGNSFNSSVKSIKKFALSLLSVRGAFTLISKAASSYLSYDTQLSNSIQNCWNVLGSLLAPILEYIINLFSKAVSYVNAFVQALTGVNLVAKANAKSLKSQASANKEANNQLSSLDDINNLNSSNNSGSSDNNPITTENVNLDSLKNKLLNADWYSIGLEVGNKINKALANINWNFIQNIAVALATDLAILLNGLVDGINWTLIGSTIGNGLNTTLLFAYTFMTTFNWEKFGTSIATGINNAIYTIDWNLLGQTLASKWVALIDWLYGFVTTFDWNEFGLAISNAVMGWWNSIDWAKTAEMISIGIRGLLTSIKEFIANIDWEKLGDDVWTFISSIDWNGMISDLAYILGQAIAGIGQFIWGFIDDAVKDIGDYFSKKIEECGGNVIEGFFKGIDDAFAGIGQWLIDNICVPFVDGFKSMFGIHSPSKVMAELGVYLVDGLKNGLSNIWKSVENIFTDLKVNISNTFNETLSAIKKVFNIENIKTHFNNAVSTIKNIFSSIPDWFRDKFTKAWENVKNVFSTGGKIFSGIKEGIEKTFTTVVNKIISGINTLIAVPFNSINKMLNKIRNIEFLGISPFKNLWSNNPLPVPVIPSLASGGVLDSETIVRVAEYSNAKSNPEIISPKSMMEDVFRNVLDDSNYSGTRIDKLVLKVLDETVFDGAIDYINEQSRIKGVSVIKEMG